MDLPDFLVNHPDGEIRLVGHRIGLYELVDRYQEGYSPEMLREDFPNLPLSLIHKVIAFYLDNQAEADAYVSAYRAELSRQEAAHQPGPAAERIRQALKAQSGDAASPLGKPS
jgi:uncharacterized protein (DUF433 family)